MNEKILQKKLKKSFVAASLIGLLIVVFSIATVAILNHSLNQMTVEEMKKMRQGNTAKGYSSK